MRARARNAMMMNEGPVSFGLGGDPSPPTADSVSLSALLASGGEEPGGGGGGGGGARGVPLYPPEALRPPEEQQQHGERVGRFHGCPAARPYRDSLDSLEPEDLRVPAAGPRAGGGAPLSHHHHSHHHHRAHHHHSHPLQRVAPWGGPGVPILPPETRAPGSMMPGGAAAAMRRAREGRFLSSLEGALMGADRASSRPLSPSSVPPMDDRPISPFGDDEEDEPLGAPTSFAEVFDSPQGSLFGDDDDNDNDDDEAAVPEPEPIPDPVPQPPVRAVAAAVEAPAPRRSSRNAARAATARISAAIATSGMVDLHEDPQESAAARKETSNTRQKSRRKAGPKTTGETSSSGASRRGGGRKRQAPIKAEVDDGRKVKAEEPVEEEQNCCICLEQPDKFERSKLNGCEHHYCFSCIEKWADRENTCPQCKQRFTKIERVHKPPTKRRRKGEKVDGEKVQRVRNTKKVKNRDQRADMHHGNPLQGLFATMEASGTMPPSIAQLIFSGLGGINGGHFGRPDGNSNAARRSVRFGISTGSNRHGSDSISLNHLTLPLNTVVRRLSAMRQEGPTGAPTGSGQNISVLGVSHHRMEDNFAPSPARNSVPPVVHHLEDPMGFPSGLPPPPPPPHGHPPVPPPPPVEPVVDDNGYSSFVQRVQQQSRERNAALERFNIAPRDFVRRASLPGAGSGPAGSFAPPPPPFAANGNTAETAVEIDDSDDDEIIEVIEVPGI